MLLRRLTRSIFSGIPSIDADSSYQRRQQELEAKDDSDGDKENAVRKLQMLKSLGELEISKEFMKNEWHFC